MGWMQLARTPRQMAAILRRARRQAGLTQAQLAQQAGLRTATVSALEQGAAGPRLDTLLAVMAVLKLDLAVQPRAMSPPAQDVFG